jgi:hypothetical protein
VELQSGQGLQGPETTDNAVATHEPSKAVAAGGNSLAWVDLCRGVLLCNVLDEEPVLRAAAPVARAATADAS